MSCEIALRQQGYRLTPQRLMVLEAVHRAEKHISAEEIFDRVKAGYPYANISTVYRTLELLKQLGLVDTIDLGEGYQRYHHAEKSDHHHLICRECGNVTEVQPAALESLQESLFKNCQFKVDLRHIALSGICSACLGSKPAGTTHKHTNPERSVRNLRGRTVAHT